YKNIEIFGSNEVKTIRIYLNLGYFKFLRMEDLDDLIWGTNATKPPTQKNNSTPLNAMRDNQLKLQEQEQRRKVHEEHQRIPTHYNQTNFWDSLERKGS
ncbi:12645_t:CDS:1, partial [Racocetra persica]